MVRFVRVRFRGSVRAERRGVFLRVIRDSDNALSGFEVDVEGDEVAPPGFERRLRIINKGAVISVREYRMSKVHGTLEPVETEEGK